MTPAHPDHSPRPTPGRRACHTITSRALGVRAWRVPLSWPASPRGHTRLRSDRSSGSVNPRRMPSAHAFGGRRFLRHAFGVLLVFRYLSETPPSRSRHDTPQTYANQAALIAVNLQLCGLSDTATASYADNTGRR